MTLPTGWTETTIGDALEVIRGISFPKDARTSEPLEDYVACLRTTNVQRQVEWRDLWFVPEQYVRREEQWLQPFDILVSVSNSLELVGKVALVTELPMRATLGAFISAVRVPQCLNAKYIYYQLASADVQQDFRSRASTTTNISNLSTSKLQETRLLIAPLPEQRRIVDAIEALFSRLDAAVAALQRVQANLKRYRAAVLKAACEGRLVPTEAALARAEGRAYEPASTLLARILAERRAQWQAAHPGKPYKAPSPPDTSTLSELPEGWCWASLEGLADIVGGVTKGRNFKGRRTLMLPYLRVANVQQGRLDLSEIKTIEALPEDLQRYRLQPGDLLLTEGGDRDKLGRSAIWRGEVEDCIHQNHIFRARLYANKLPPEWLMYNANSESGRNYFMQRGKQTTNLASINLTQLRAFPVALAPSEELARTLDELESRLSIIEEIETTVRLNLVRAAHLRQAILQRAFAGKLVPQDGQPVQMPLLP